MQYAHHPCHINKATADVTALPLCRDPGISSQMAPSDIQSVKDNNADASSSFFNGCREASRYTVNEVIGKGR